MAQISIQDLTFCYDGGSENVFDGVSINIDTDWKLGLVGRNGRGKTTLLKLLEGEYEYSGKISANVKFVYFPFAVDGAERAAVEVVSDICPSAEEWMIMREADLLELDADALYRPFCELSNGERTKLLLAGLFLTEGGFFLIDEPTNHLDLAAREAVAAYLKRKSGFIIVSHDRAFLDGCIDHVMSINRTNIEIQSGDFSSYLENFERDRAFEAARNERLKKDIARLTEAARRTSDWSDKTEASKYGKASSGLKQDKGYVGHKAAKLMKRAKSAELRRERAVEEKSKLLHNVERNEDLKMFPLSHRSERIVAVDGASLFYGGREVLSGVKLEVKRGERVALDGRNGCGKSSLLKLIAGADIEHTGAVAVASGAVVSFVPQSTEGLGGGLTEFARDRKLDESLFKTVLRKMGFERSEFDNDLSELSQGQRKKVCLAASLCTSAHLYIWDEPLNYIDIYSRLQIERLLCEFCPTMIFVEHDKAFRERAATRIARL